MQQNCRTPFDVALQHHLEGRIEDAVAGYREALQLQPNYADAHNNLAVALVTQGRIDEASVHFEKALQLKPDSADALNNLANWLGAEGRLESAITHYGRAITLRPDYAEAHFNRAEIKTFRSGDADLAALQALASRPDLPIAAVPYVHFALGKALEDTGDYQRAFEHLQKGNMAKRSQIPYDEAKAEEIFERTATAFPGWLMERGNALGDETPSLKGPVPIFVVGMPRSGSTLIEQVLASHPQVHAAGEVTYLEQAIAEVAADVKPGYPDCVSTVPGEAFRRIGEAYLRRASQRSNGRAWVVDKLPGNFLHIGLIRLAIPQARIIHTIREPLDTCVSCYSKLFSTSQYFSYDLAELGRHYRRYWRMMAHWRSVLPTGLILDVPYESVVDNLEGQARRILKHCGLTWDERCLAFHQSSRPVTTASSVQARQPVYRTSVQRWRRYEAWLEPLLNELGIHQNTKSKSTAAGRR